MIVQHLKEYLTNNNLPGKAFQEEIAPYRKTSTDFDYRALNPREASVCLLLFEKNDEWTSVLIERSEYDGVHSKQIAFPGGKKEDSDLSDWATAKRETEEEIGIQRENIELITPLTELYIPPSNFIVKPFIGLIDKEPNYSTDPREVNAVIEYPFEQLIAPNIIKETFIKLSNGTRLKTPYFDIDNRIVWGATAMILMEARELLLRIKKRPF